MRKKYVYNISKLNNWSTTLQQLWIDINLSQPWVKHNCWTSKVPLLSYWIKKVCQLLYQKLPNIDNCILRNMAYPFSYKNLHKSNVRCFSMTALWRQLSPLECWPRTQIHPWSLYISHHVAFDDVHSKCVVKLKEKNRNG